jgi:protein TonB
MVRFRMDRSGKVLSYSLVRSSGFDALDKEALAMIERAQPLPALPPEIPGDAKEIVLPAQFLMRNAN